MVFVQWREARQGRDSVKTILEDNPELMGELEGLIKEKLAS